MLKKIKSVSYYIVLILVLFNTTFTIITITNNKNKIDLLNFNDKDILILNEKDKYLRVKHGFDFDTVIIYEEDLKPFKIDFNSVSYGFLDERFLFIRYTVKDDKYYSKTSTRFIGQIKIYIIESKEEPYEKYYVVRYKDFLALTK